MATRAKLPSSGGRLALDAYHKIILFSLQVFTQIYKLMHGMNSLDRNSAMLSEFFSTDLFETCVRKVITYYPASAMPAEFNNLLSCLLSNFFPKFSFAFELLESVCFFTITYLSIYLLCTLIFRHLMACLIG